MKRHAINCLLVLSFVAILFGLAACKQEPPAPKTTGTVNVTITDSTEKTPASWKITVRNEAGKVLKSAVTTQPSWNGEVEVGAVNITVEAISSTNKVVGSGYAEATVSGGESSNVAVTARRLVFMTAGSTTLAFDTLEEAVAAALASGESSAVIEINGEISVASTMTVTDFDLTVRNYNGAVGIINDAVMTSETDTGSTSNQVARMFQINGTSKFVAGGNTTGKLVINGAPEGSAAHSVCNRRVLFFLGTKAADKASGSVTLNDGLEVCGIYADGPTAFGIVVRGYGNVTINGGHYHDNFMNGNGLFCVYATTVVNGGKFENNTSNGSSSIIQNAASGANLTINNGKFIGNRANYSCVITVAGATTTVNNGEFRDNTGTIDSQKCGAALHGNNAATVIVNINGGTFSGNAPYDYYRNNSTLTVAPTVTLNTN